MSEADVKAGQVGRNGNGGAAPALSLQVVEDVTRIDAAAWDALLDAAPHPTPFMRHAYLAALQRSGSAVADTGWQPLYLLLHDEGAGSADGSADGRPVLRGACALYLKSHSYGEYVFDWAWADAWHKAGRDYYPKLLGAVPFTPVPGSRLLARDAAARLALLQGMSTLAHEQGWSSAHLLFMDEADQAAATEAGWLLRQGVQFHWSNRSTGADATTGAPLPPWRDWDDYLASLTRDKRKKLVQERGYVARAGVEFEVKRGSEIGAEDWEHFYRCYCSTYREHHSTPYLSRAFFDDTHAALPGLWLMFIARRAGQRVAASLVALDDATRTAWGRYWGATESISHLHFAACYHEPLRWCVEHGWQRFEGGAQGEHKLARGLLPVATWSAHWLADPGFSSAVARFLERERAGIESYMDELQAHSPFRAGRTQPEGTLS